MQTWRRS